MNLPSWIWTIIIIIIIITISIIIIIIIIIISIISIISIIIIIIIIHSIIKENDSLNCSILEFTRIERFSVTNFVWGRDEIFSIKCLLCFSLCIWSQRSICDNDRIHSKKKNEVQKEKRKRKVSLFRKGGVFFSFSLSFAEKFLSPLDMSEEQFLSVSFLLEDKEKWKPFYEENGFVVFRDVLAEEEVSFTVNEIFTSPSLLDGKVRKEDETTWKNWPGWVPGAQNKGFLSSPNELRDTACWLNRQNPKVVSCFQNVLEKEELRVKEDRFGAMRPTLDHPEWETVKSWLHFDQNPVVCPSFFGVQGILALTEHTKTSGGFLCIPGFHKRFHDWSLTHSFSAIEIPLKVPDQDPIQKEVVRILIPRGGLLIWDSRLPHANWPNESADEFRLVQYVTFFPLSPDNDLEKNKQKWEARLRYVGNESNRMSSLLTPLGKKILGIKDWKQQEGEEEEEEEDEDEENKGKKKEEEEKQQKARELMMLAEKKEAEGDCMGAMELYRSAFKLDPSLELLF